MEIPLVGYGVRDRSLRVSPQFLKNVYPRRHTGKSSEFSLQHTAGTTLFCDLGDDACRMMHVVGGVLYAVSGDSLYSINSAGTSTLLSSSIGGTGPIKGDDDGANLVMPYGDTDVWNISGGTLTNLTSLGGGAEPNYEQSSACAFVGRRIAFVEDNSGRFFLGDIDDPTTFSALFQTAEARPDNLVSIHQFKSHLWLYGARSMEGWYLSDESFPLNPFPNGAFDIGCAARNSVASSDTYMAWLSETLRVYATTGAAPIAISSPELEYELSNMTVVSDASGFIYTEEGHTFYVLSLPTADRTFAFDFSTNEWHERSSGGGRFNADCYAYAYNSHFVSDPSDGKIYKMSLNYSDDDGDAFIREFILPVVQLSGQSLTLNKIELVVDVGVQPDTENDTTMQMRWTDNGHTWSNWGSLPMGETGEFFSKIKYSNLGSFEDRFFHFRTATKGPLRVIKAFAEGDSGQRR